MNILLAQEDLETREKLSFSIEATFSGALVTRVATFAELQDALENADPSWDLLILDLPSISPKEFEALLSKHQNLGTLLIEQPKDSPHTREIQPGWNILGTIERAMLLENASLQIRKLMELNRITSTLAPTDEYTKIKTQILLSVAPLKGDIFIKLGAGHFVKVLHQGESFDRSDLEKYTTKKKIEYLHVRTDQAQEFIQKYQEELKQLLGKSHQFSLQQMAEMSDSIYDTIQSLGNSVGFTKEVQNLAKTQMRMTVNSMGKSPQLSQILERLEAFKGEYISSHSTLTAYLACAIASHLEWGSEATFHKLTLAAMLHDIVLENHALAMCETIAEVDEGDFTDDEKKAYRIHMVKSAEVARQFTEVPADVDAIIAQHHERPDGKGFPRGMTSNYISPLGAVFIVAHDMAKHSLAAGHAGFKPSDFLAVAHEKYTTSQFRKVVTAIEKLYPDIA